MKVARPVHHGRKNCPPGDPKQVSLMHGAVPGPLKVPHKAYFWALRNSLISAVNSEMITNGWSTRIFRWPAGRSEAPGSVV